MNETELLNTTMNVTSNVTQNETVKTIVAQAGQGSLNLIDIAAGIFNNGLTEGVAQAINGYFHITWVSGALILSVFVLGMLYFKWGAVTNWFGSIGSYVILSAIAFVIAKGMGIL